MARDRHDRLAATRTESPLRGLVILLAGVGHLGLPLAMLLARMRGIAEVRLLDRGRVQEKHVASEGFPRSTVGMNKAEAAACILRDNGCPTAIKVIPCDLEDVPHGLFQVDACLAGLDSLLARQVLINALALPLGVVVIDGGLGDGNVGRVSVYAPHGACPECGWGPRDYEHLATEYPCVPGTVYAPPSTNSPPAVTSVVAGLMAAELEWLAAADGGPGHSRELLCDVPTRFLNSRLRRAAACRYDHAVVATRIPLAVPFAAATVGDLLEAVAAHYPGLAPSLEFRRGLVEASEIFAASRHVVPSQLESRSQQSLEGLGLHAEDLVRVRTPNPSEDAFVQFLHTGREGS